MSYRPKTLANQHTKYHQLFSIGRSDTVDVPPPPPPIVTIYPYIFLWIYQIKNAKIIQSIYGTSCIHKCTWYGNELDHNILHLSLWACLTIFQVTLSMSASPKLNPLLFRVNTSPTPTMLFSNNRFSKLATQVSTLVTNRFSKI